MKTPLLSICIPTINRQKLLTRALRSISESNQRDLIQICISNNASEEDYSDIEKTCEELRAAGFEVKYHKHDMRISLDENMFYCTQMAKGNYIYYLGDDDYFYKNSVDQILTLINQHNPSFVIFRGYFSEIIPPETATIESFKNTEEAYLFLYDKITFGTILIDRKLLNPDYFKKLIGTSHAYASFLISLFEMKSTKIYYVSSPVVCLGVDNKTYSKYFLDVTFSHIPKWFNLMADLTNSEVFHKVKKMHLKKMMTPQRLIFFKGQGLPIASITTLVEQSTFWTKLYLSSVDLIPGFLCRFAYVQYRKKRRS